MHQFSFHPQQYVDQKAITQHRIKSIVNFIYQLVFSFFQNDLNDNNNRKNIRRNDGLPMINQKRINYNNFPLSFKY